MFDSIWLLLTSILIGVVSNLLTPYVSTRFDNMTNSRRLRNQQRQTVFENSVEFIMNHPNEEIILRIRYMQTGFGAGLLLTLGIVMMVSSNLVQVVLGFIFSLVSYYILALTRNRGKIIDTVNNRKKQANPNLDLN